VGGINTDWEEKIRKRDGKNWVTLKGDLDGNRQFNEDTVNYLSTVYLMVAKTLISPPAKKLGWLLGGAEDYCFTGASTSSSLVYGKKAGGKDSEVWWDQFS